MPKNKLVLSIVLAWLLLSCGGNDNHKMFSLLSSKTTGIKFKNILRETEDFNVLEYGYLYNGGGVAIGDLNNDGLSDIYFTGNMVGSHLYLNQGNFKFKEIAKEAGVFAEGLWNTGTTMADVNGDGYLDIYVCRSAAKVPNNRKNLLFINNGASIGSGEVSFTERGEEYGVADSGYTTQAAFFDYDRDGDLDLYILNHSSQEYAGFGQITASLKNRKNSAYSDKLYRNDKGKYNEVSQEAGLVSNVLGFGLGIAISDINNDGWLDIYISNDYNEQDYLYINNQNGSFTESLEQFIGHVSLFSMGSDIADINNDGYTDIMTLDMLPEGNSRQKMVSGPDNYDKYQLLVNSGFYNQTMRNMLQLNNQGESFSEIGQFSGISNTDWSWASLFADFDNDGFKDLFITNGYKRDYTNMDFMNYAVQEKLKENRTRQSKAIMELIEKIPATIEENYMYRNKGDLTFQKMNIDWGIDQKSLSNGAAYADLDNDGDLDLVVNNIDSEAFIYRNNSELLTSNHSLKVKLIGAKGNVFGVGAKVELKVGNHILAQEMIPTRGYQSSVDYGLLFGIGKTRDIDELKITWPDGKIQHIKNIQANKTITLNHTEAIAGNARSIIEKSKYFTSVSMDSLIGYNHRENSFVDFKREQLLPHKLSTQGPKISQADINGDGLEDLFIGGAKDSPGQIFVQDKSGKFDLLDEKSFDKDKESEDIGALFFDADNDGDQDLYVVSGGNDYDANSNQLKDRLYLNNGIGNFTKSLEGLPKMLSSGSCAKAADFDNDGDLDLFIGGRLIPGNYPNAARSYILENDGKGNFKDITARTNPMLEYPGMVTDANWGDFNGDGKNDLIIVGEFMAIRAFRNEHGKLEELSEASGLKNSQGWWNKIIAEDFDGDGDLDYVIGNFGLNSQLKASLEKPVSLYVSDFDKNGSIDPVLCSYIGNESYPVFSKDDLVGQLSNLKGRYVNYVDYADQKITDIFTADQLQEAGLLEAKIFESSYMENLGDGRFQLSPLPKEAQFSPIFGIIAKDFDLDGNLDILLAGNFFGTRVKYGRYDANKGLLMLGDGKGKFNSLNNRTSGLNLVGEIRDIAVLEKKNADVLVIFAQNNGPLLIYKVNQPSQQ